MSREWDDSGDCEIPLELWERSLVNALNGKRGQAFLKELETELLAMKSLGEGRLLQGFLVADGTPRKRGYGWLGEPEREVASPVGCCTIGVMMKKKCSPEYLKGWTNREIESAHDYPSDLKRQLRIPDCIIAEIGVTNDSGKYGNQRDETDEQRFDRMLAWVQDHIQKNGEKVKR